jgi:hypothetical protein
MVAFWKDVATKVGLDIHLSIYLSVFSFHSDSNLIISSQAPHHSRASWMKYWRRHKHELERSETDAPLPPAPDKKMRYSRGDDLLLAKHFVNKIEGKSDQIFQAFARMVSPFFFIVSIPFSLHIPFKSRMFSLC